MRAIKLVAGAMSVLCVGCSTMDVMVQRQGETEKRLESLAQSGAIRDQRVSDLAAEVSLLQRTTRNNSEELETLRSTVVELRAALDKGGASSGTVSKIEVVNREATDREGESGPPVQYVQAFGLFSANSYAEAIASFDAFLRSNPASEYAGNAHYWVGECYFALKDYGKAIASYQKVLDRYPASPKVPDAMLKIAYSHSSLKEPQRARQLMDKLLQNHPETPAAVKAREWLSRQ